MPDYLATSSPQSVTVTNSTGKAITLSYSVQNAQNSGNTFGSSSSGLAIILNIVDSQPPLEDKGADHMEAVGVYVNGQRQSGGLIAWGAAPPGAATVHNTFGPLLRLDLYQHDEADSAVVASFYWRAEDVPVTPPDVPVTPPTTGGTLSSAEATTLLDGLPQLYAGLLFADPMTVQDPCSVEVTHVTYAREMVVASRSGTVFTTTETMSWPGLPPGTTIAGVGLFDAPVNGNLRLVATLQPPVLLQKGGSYSVSGLVYGFQAGGTVVSGPQTLLASSYPDQPISGLPFDCDPGSDLHHPNGRVWYGPKSLANSAPPQGFGFSLTKGAVGAGPGQVVEVALSFTGTHEPGANIYFYGKNSSGCSSLRSSASASALLDGASPFRASYTVEEGFTFLGVMAYGSFYDSTSRTVYERSWAIIGFE